MKVVLINSGNDPPIGGNANDGSYPPLGIIALGTDVKRAYGDDVDVVLYDGQVDDVDFLAAEIKRLRADIVGVSIYLTSIRNSLRLIKEAKNCGAITVLGNDHAIEHCELLLRKVPEVDYICMNDVGEETLTALVGVIRDGGDPRTVPLLAFRDGDRIVTTSVPSAIKPGLSLDRIAIPDRHLLASRYWQSYTAGFKGQHRKTWDSSAVHGVATINRARGCSQMKNPCQYCGIVDLNIRFSSGEVFWNDVRAARDQVDAGVLYEAFDSATSGPQILKRWLKARPDDLAPIRFKMYAQAFETDARRVELFKALNVFCVNMGLDSGDDEVLKMLKGDRHSLAQNKRAARLYTDAGIEIYTSFVLFGLGDEDRTRRSLDRTLEFVDWMAANTSVVSFDSALLYPDKFSPVGRLLWGGASEATRKKWSFLDEVKLRAFADRYRDEVYIDPTDFTYSFADLCGVRHEVLVEYDRQIQRIATARGLNYGQSQGGAGSDP